MNGFFRAPFLTIRRTNDVQHDNNNNPPKKINKLEPKEKQTEVATQLSTPDKKVVL